MTEQDEHEFRRRWAESDGFDVEALMKIYRPPRVEQCGSRVVDFFQFDDNYKCEKNSEIFLYARMAIHNYNMIQGTNLQVLSIEDGFCIEGPPRYADTKINLVAKDPDAGGSLVPFQARLVRAGYYPIKTLTCSIARPKPLAPPTPVVRVEDDIEDVVLPKWPPESAFDDKTRFYMLEKSEVLKYEWIRLYMEIAFLTANSCLWPNLSRLEILKVAVEREGKPPPTSESLKDAGDAIFYIKYKFLRGKRRRLRTGRGQRPPCDRIAIVKRSMGSDGLFKLAFQGKLSKTLLQSQKGNEVV